jgi:hypothetical protein
MRFHFPVPAAKRNHNSTAKKINLGGALAFGLARWIVLQAGRAKSLRSKKIWIQEINYRQPLAFLKKYD